MTQSVAVGGVSRRWRRVVVQGQLSPGPVVPVAVRRSLRRTTRTRTATPGRIGCAHAGGCGGAWRRRRRRCCGAGDRLAGEPPDRAGRAGRAAAGCRAWRPGRRASRGAARRAADAIDRHAGGRHWCSRCAAARADGAPARPNRRWDSRGARRPRPAHGAPDEGELCIACRRVWQGGATELAGASDLSRPWDSSVRGSRWPQVRSAQRLARAGPMCVVNRLGGWFEDSFSGRWSG